MTTRKSSSRNCRNGRGSKIKYQI